VTGGLQRIAGESHELRKRKPVQQYKGRITFYQKPELTTVIREEYKY